MPPFYRRHPLVAALLALLLAAAVVDHAFIGHQEDDYRRYHDRAFVVVSVLSSVTIEIDCPDGRNPITRVRLRGVAALEPGEGGERLSGPAASAFAEETLLGKQIGLELAPNGSRDGERRLLAYVRLMPGGASYNELLLEKGFARSDAERDHPFRRRYQSVEGRARRRSAGLWAEIKPEGFADGR